MLAKVLPNLSLLKLQCAVLHFELPHKRTGLLWGDVLEMKSHL